MTKDEMVREMKRRRDERTRTWMDNSEFHLMCSDVLFEVIAEAVAARTEERTPVVSVHR